MREVSVEKNLLGQIAHSYLTSAPQPGTGQHFLRTIHHGTGTVELCNAHTPGQLYRYHPQGMKENLGVQKLVLHVASCAVPIQPPGSK